MEDSQASATEEARIEAVASSLNEDEKASSTKTQTQQESLNNKGNDESLDDFGKQILAARRRRRRRQPNRPSEWTPHQQLNFAVYLVLVTVAILVLNHEYGNLFSVYLQHYFPREAAVFGLKEQQQGQQQ